MRPGFVIDDARGPGGVDEARGLFEAYAASLDVDLCFQNFAAEVAALPGDYAPPRGCLLLAKQASIPVGCVALRPLSREGVDAREKSAAEIKRLFVQPAVRGTGLGRALAMAVITRARAAGYGEVKLDTLPTMTEARALYRTIGFVECAPYGQSVLPGTICMTLPL